MCVERFSGVRFSVMEGQLKRNLTVIIMGEVWFLGLGANLPLPFSPSPPFFPSLARPSRASPPRLK